MFFEKLLKLLVLVYLVFLCVNSFAMNDLIKVVYKGNTTARFSDAQTILKKHLAKKMELGTFRFYFSNKPIINLVPQKDAVVEQKKISFIFPKTKCKDRACKKMINKVNDLDSLDFNLQIKDVKTPIDGIQLLITYDPKKVTFVYDFFESVGAKQGVVFKFYNKSLVENIQNKYDTVLRTVLGKKKNLLSLIADMVDMIWVPVDVWA